MWYNVYVHVCKQLGDSTFFYHLEQILWGNWDYPRKSGHIPPVCHAFPQGQGCPWRETSGNKNGLETTQRDVNKKTKTSGFTHMGLLAIHQNIGIREFVTSYLLLYKKMDLQNHLEAAHGISLAIQVGLCCSHRRLDFQRGDKFWICQNFCRL